MSMSLQPSPWPFTTRLRSGKDGEDILVDGGAFGDVRSKTGEKGLFDQRDDGFACVGSRGTPAETFFGASGAISLPLKGAKTVKMARPPHNSG